MGPTLITFIDQSVDISFAFNANEEENSAKNHVGFEFLIQEGDKPDLVKQFLRTKSSVKHYYQLADNMVFLEVSSPPPKNT